MSAELIVSGVGGLAKVMICPESEWPEKAMTRTAMKLRRNVEFFLNVGIDVGDVILAVPIPVRRLIVSF